MTSQAIIYKLGNLVLSSSSTSTTRRSFFSHLVRLFHPLDIVSLSPLRDLTID